MSIATLDDPRIDLYLDTAAHGMRLGAGPPLRQLNLSGDLWDIHVEVVRKAIRQRQDELEILSPRGEKFFEIPQEVDDGQ